MIQQSEKQPKQLLYQQSSEIASSGRNNLQYDLEPEITFFTNVQEEESQHYQENESQQAYQNQFKHQDFPTQVEKNIEKANSIDIKSEQKMSHQKSRQDPINSNASIFNHQEPYIRKQIDNSDLIISPMTIRPLQITVPKIQVQARKKLEEAKEKEQTSQMSQQSSLQRLKSESKKSSDSFKQLSNDQMSDEDTQEQTQNELNEFQNLTTIFKSKVQKSENFSQVICGFKTPMQTKEKIINNQNMQKKLSSIRLANRKKSQQKQQKQIRQSQQIKDLQYQNNSFSQTFTSKHNKTQSDKKKINQVNKKSNSISLNKTYDIKLPQISTKNSNKKKTKSENKQKITPIKQKPPIIKRKVELEKQNFPVVKQQQKQVKKTNKITNKEKSRKQALKKQVSEEVIKEDEQNNQFDKFEIFKHIILSQNDFLTSTNGKKQNTQNTVNQTPFLYLQYHQI